MTNKPKSSKPIAIQPNKPQIMTEKDKLLSEATEQFVESYNEIRECLAAEETTIFESRYKIGKIVKEIATSASSDYGSNAVQRMAELISAGRDIVYQSLLFVQSYEEEEMKELTQLRNKEGDPLLWTHITHLIRVPDRKTRDLLLKKTLDENWTPGQLLIHVQGAKGGKSNPKAGKPLARPKSIRGFIDQQATYIEQLLKRKEKVWAGTEKPGDSSFFDLLESTPLDKMDEKTMTELGDLEDKFELAASELEGMATELSRVRRKIEQRREESVDNYEDDDAEEEDEDNCQLPDDEDEEEDEPLKEQAKDDEDEDEEEEEEENIDEEEAPRKKFTNKKPAKGKR
jgi:hypothetical protein